MEAHDADPLTQPEYNQFFAEEELDAELQPHLTTIGEYTYIHHPLVVSLYTPGLNHIFNQQLKAAQANIREAINKKDWNQYIFTFARPYRLEAFSEIKNILTEDTFWKLVSEVWTDSENIYQNFDKWVDLFLSRKDKNPTPSGEIIDKAFFASLPNDVVIYRGCGVKNKLGMSWTTKKDIAYGFSRRYVYSEPAFLVTARVKKEDIFAVFTGRDEFEVVVLPDEISIIKEENIER